MSDEGSGSKKRGRYEPTIYLEGMILPDGHWFNLRKEAKPLANEFRSCIFGVGLEKVSDEFWRAIYWYIFKNGSLEYSTLTQNQKTSFGEYCELFFIDLFGWKKNDKGHDAKLDIEVDGETVAHNIEIKCSSNSSNKPDPDEVEAQKTRRRPPKTNPIPSAWQISKECADRINFLISVDTYANNFSIGILDCSQDGFLSELVIPKENEPLPGGPKRDGKRTVTPLGKQNIVWIVYKSPLKPNPFISRKNLAEKLLGEYRVSFNRLIDGELDQGLARD